MRALHPFLIASLLSLPALAGTTPPAAKAVQTAAASKTSAPERAFFESLIGTWDVVYDLYDKHGEVRHLPGQVTYAWILDGQALQETWSDVAGKTVKPYGTTIGYLDIKHGRWNEVWVYPEANMTMLVRGSISDGRAVLTGRDETGATQRWTIGAVQGDAFDSRFESSIDEGKTWRILSVNHMKRHAAP